MLFMKKTKQLGIFVGLILFVVAPSAFAVTTDYVNYWSFDDATGRSIGDTGGQNGVMTGSSTGFGWASGKSGTALGMDGMAGQGVALPNAFLNGSQGTISVWFKMEDLSDRNIIFSGKSTTDNNIYAFLSLDREGRPQFQFRSEANGNDRKAQGTKILNKNEWYHLVFIADAQSYKMYINGEMVTMAGDNIGRWFPDITNHPLMYRIGSSEATPLVGSFNGMLDELRIYNRALSGSEVTMLYNEGNDAKPTVPMSIRPQLTFTSSSGTAPAGGSVTLNWNATNVDTCSGGNGLSGAVPLVGSRVMNNLGMNTTYTLTCVGKGGQTEQSVNVRVGTSTGMSSSATSTGGTLTITDVTPVKPVVVSTTSANIGATMNAETRRALIQDLLKQIMKLIGELQNQLAVMKAAGVQ